MRRSLLLMWDPCEKCKDLGQSLCPVSKNPFKVARSNSGPFLITSLSSLSCRSFASWLVSLHIFLHTQTCNLTEKSWEILRLVFGFRLNLQSTIHVSSQSEGPFHTNASTFGHQCHSFSPSPPTIPTPTIPAQTIPPIKSFDRCHDPHCFNLEWPMTVTFVTSIKITNLNTTSTFFPGSVISLHQSKHHFNLSDESRAKKVKCIATVFSTKGNGHGWSCRRGAVIFARVLGRSRRFISDSFPTLAKAFLSSKPRV